MQPKIKPYAPDSPLDQDASRLENSDDGHFVLRDVGEIWIVSGIKGVKRGQELTYDYGTDYF
jgi:hypothetical protein